jgi:hypothetical protein
LKKRLLLALPPLRLSDYVTVIGTALFLGVVLFAVVQGPKWQNWQSSSHWGFGKDWDCALVAYPVCIKRP